MKIEISAGGVVYRKMGQEIEILLIKDKNGTWTFPKGLIEVGEDKIETAEREIQEEVGLKHLEFQGEISAIQYFYRRDGDLIKKTVFYYLFESKGGEKVTVQKDEGIEDAAWLAWDEALKNIGYKKTNERILDLAIQLISPPSRKPVGY